MLAKLIGNHAVLCSLQLSKVPRIATAVAIDPGGDLGDIIQQSSRAVRCGQPLHAMRGSGFTRIL